MLESIISSIIFAFFTFIAGVITTFISKKRLEQEKVFKQKAEEIAKSVTSQAEQAKARAIEEIAKRLPEEKRSPEELSKLLSQSLNIGGNLVIQNDRSSQEVELVQDLVTGYHQQALSQAKVQFWFSVAAATVGFAFIIYSASGVSLDNLASLLKTVPGAVIDAVALLFFRQAEQTRERATALYDRLRADSQMRSARELVGGIEDTQIKSAVKAQIALHMAGLTPKEIDIHSLIRKQP